MRDAEPEVDDEDDDAAAPPMVNGIASDVEADERLELGSVGGAAAVRCRGRAIRSARAVMLGGDRRRVVADDDADDDQADGRGCGAVEEDAADRVPLGGAASASSVRDSQARRQHQRHGSAEEGEMDGAGRQGDRDGDGRGRGSGGDDRRRGCPRRGRRWRSGSAERTKSGSASSVPPSGDTKRRAAAKPAPIPTMAICIIFRCPAVWSG